MKLRIFLIAVVLFTAGSFTMEALGQENIKAMIKKCETMDVIDANIVRHYPSNAQTSSNRQATASSSFINSPRSIINITLKYTPELEREIVVAFRKDQEKVTREVEQRKEGKVTHMLYRFEDSEYSFTIKNDTISIRATEGMFRESIVSFPAFITDSLRIQPLNNLLITGKVTDTRGKPLSGVFVAIKGSSLGTVTDTHGAYTMVVRDENKMLVFSYTGFRTQEVVVGNARTINVILRED